MTRHDHDALALGEAGERFAEAHLKKRGYRVLETNVRSRRGEIDIVALQGKTLCFIEVKTRRSLSAGTPEEGLDDRKIARLVRAAKAYLTSHRMHDKPVRFDLLALRALEDGGFEPNLVQGAFYSDGWR